MTFTFYGFGQMPGISEIRETVENEVFWGNWEYNRSFILNAAIDSTTVDAGNGSTPTVLRPGLLMGVITATKKWAHYDAGAADGTEVLRGILCYAITTESGVPGVQQDRYLGWINCAGTVKASGILVPGETDIGLVGTAAEAVVRAAMASRWILDDEFYQ